MEMPSFLIALLGLLATLVSADVVVVDGSGDVTTSPEQDVPQYASSSALQLNLPTPAGQPNPLQYSLIPLTQNIGLNESATSRAIISISGNMVAVGVSNYNQITTGDVAYLSCDNSSSASFITPDTMLNAIMAVSPKAIVLYTQNSSWCSIDNTSSIAYTSILSMADATDASQVLGYLNGTDSGQAVSVSINGNLTAADASASSSSGGGSSTVAMSILYSITGLITVLFIIIIATGALRAHRYPERYGPRSALGGRPRQSRAKGLARAVLETLPIVKFNNQEPTKPDPELELETATTDGRETGASRTGSNLAEDRQPVVAVAAGGNGNEDPTPATDSHQAPEASNEGDGSVGCSICTEDFKVGEDMRVLPCNHQFHPACIDPWLVNVSGTCPLCRLDLRPRATGATSGASTAERGSTLPPPLALEAEDGVGTSASHRHRSSRIFDANRLRHATPEEQMAALRQMRSTRTEPEAEEGNGIQEAAEARGADETHEAAGAQEADGEERGQRTRLAAKLKEKFRIRTRARSPNRQNS